jgi:hypothetical protein
MVVVDTRNLTKGFCAPKVLRREVQSRIQPAERHVAAPEATMI